MANKPYYKKGSTMPNTVGITGNSYFLSGFIPKGTEGAQEPPVDKEPNVLVVHSDTFSDPQEAYDQAVEGILLKMEGAYAGSRNAFVLQVYWREEAGGDWSCLMMAAPGGVNSVGVPSPKIPDPTKFVPGS